MAIFIDREMLESWIGIEFAPDFKPTGKIVADIEGVGSQNIAFRLDHPDTGSTVLSMLRSNICFAIDLPPNTIFNIHAAPISQGERYIEYDTKTYKIRQEYYKSLYDRLRLLINSPILRHIKPINIVSHRIALALTHYWTSGRKSEDREVLKLYSHLIGSTYIHDILREWSALDPERVKQYWLERGSFAADSYDVTVADERMYLGESARLASNARQTLAHIDSIFDDLEVKKELDFKANPLIPYMIAFTSGYDFDWDSADRILEHVFDANKSTRSKYVYQIAEISHILNNVQYMRSIPGVMATRAWFSIHDMNIVTRIMSIVLDSI